MAKLRRKDGITILDIPSVKTVRELVEHAIDYGVDLRHVDLENADLAGADLSTGDFRGALFNGADLRNANFSSADVRGASFLEAKINERTRFRDLFFLGSEFEGAVVERPEYETYERSPK